MQVKFLGHACVQFVGSKTVLVDPYLSGNPLAAAKADEVSADYILVTHGHGDHLGDAVAIAKRCGAVVICMVELARWFAKEGVCAIDLNVGGSWQDGEFSVKAVPAWHSSVLPDGGYCGLALGFVFRLDGKCIYHAGDTALFGDMREVIALNKPDLACLPIGDHYTMGADDALIAAKWLGAKQYLPIHFDTFPVIKQDAAAWAKRVREEVGAAARALKPGEAMEI